MDKERIDKLNELINKLDPDNEVFSDTRKIIEETEEEKTNE